MSQGQPSPQQIYETQSRMQLQQNAAGLERQNILERSKQQRINAAYQLRMNLMERFLAETPLMYVNGIVHNRLEDPEEAKAQERQLRQETRDISAAIDIIMSEIAAISNERMEAKKEHSESEGG